MLASAVANETPLCVGRARDVYYKREYSTDLCSGAERRQVLGAESASIARQGHEFALRTRNRLKPFCPLLV